LCEELRLLLVFTQRKPDERQTWITSTSGMSS
jgi:hypothetical protein